VPVRDVDYVSTCSGVGLEWVGSGKYATVEQHVSLFIYQISHVTHHTSLITLYASPVHYRYSLLPGSLALSCINIAFAPRVNDFKSHDDDDDDDDEDDDDPSSSSASSSFIFTLGHRCRRR
jgi:hypothetical protein